MARYTRKPIDVAALLHNNPLWAGQQQTELVRQLNTELLHILQLETLHFCKVNLIQHGRVQIICTSASWAQRLKMQRAAILDNFRRNVLPECAGIDIEVNPNCQLQYQTHVIEPQMTRPMPQISEQAAVYLTNLAKHTDPVLAEKLRKLAELAQSQKPK